MRLRSRLKQRMDSGWWILMVYSAAAIFMKSIVLDGYIVTRPYSVPQLRNAIDGIPSLLIYFCFVVIVIAPCLLFKNKGHNRYLIGLNLLCSVLFIIDLWYYRAFSRFTTVHHLGEVQNLHNLSASVSSFVHPTDFLFLLDVVFLIVALQLWKQQPGLRKSWSGFCFLLVLPSGYLFHFNAAYPINEVKLFAFRWSPFETVLALSPIGYHLYDAFAYWTEIQQLQLKQAERAEIRSWMEANDERLPPNKYQGLFRGQNLILVQAESLENFVIGKTVDGQEITPSLNGLLGNSLYFRNYLEQVGDGTSSDAEFMANTSIYPLQRGSVGWRYPSGTYNSLPKLLKRRGYLTMDIHPDPSAYWNWAQMMTSVGMSRCIDGSHFAADDVFDLGLSDGSFLRQVVPILTGLDRPFYVYMITLSNHGPYNLPARYRALHLEPSLDGSEVGGYLQSVHYTDRHIGLFLERLEGAGLLKDTVVVIFGDHCGIHKFYPEEVEERPTEERKWMENGSRIPLLVYKKGMRGELIDVIGGQIDLLPTIACLMGVDEREFAATAMGRNLLNTRRSFALLNDGQLVAAPADQGEKARARRGMELADKIIRSDYFKGQ
jgi:lipoteichoic acid synthase